MLACIHFLSCPPAKRPLEKVICDETVMRIQINSWAAEAGGFPCSEAVTLKACLNELTPCAQSPDQPVMQYLLTPPRYTNIVCIVKEIYNH